jgi:phosphate butyryltransferase
VSISTLDQLLPKAKERPICRVAVTAAHDVEVLRSVDQAQERGIATADLIGDAHRIEAIARENRLSLRGIVIEDQTDERAATMRAMTLVREGKARAVIKGQIQTDLFLEVALDPEQGIRDKALLSHVAVFEVPGFDRLLYMSDSEVVLHPNTMQKLVIMQNATDVAHKLGLEEPKVAILSAYEQVHPSRPLSIEALALTRMAQEGWVEGAIVDGPMPLDVALYPEMALLKGVGGAVAGHADIVIVPNVEAGHMVSKAIQYPGNGQMATVVVGARVPVVISSRTDDALTRLRSIALAALVAA